MNAIEELRRLAHELATQDNAITSDPLYTVQRNYRQYGMDADYCENFAWVDAEYPEHPLHDDATDPEDRERLALLEKAHDGEIDWPTDKLGSEQMWTRTGYLDRWEFVQAFLTLEAAERFRRDQAHNVGESRIYVESGYSNPEWRLLRALVAQLGHDHAYVSAGTEPLTYEAVEKLYHDAEADDRAAGSLFRLRCHALQQCCTHKLADGRTPDCTRAFDTVEGRTFCGACGKEL